MSATFVLDCSMTIAWAFADERTDETEEIRKRASREAVCVPAHWFLETCNSMLSAVRRKRISEADARLFLASLKPMQREIDAAFIGHSFDRLVDVMIAHGLTSYDAAYLEIASRRSLPLASLDDPLRTAARASGITVLGKA